MSQAPASPRRIAQLGATRFRHDPGQGVVDIQRRGCDGAVGSGKAGGLQMRIPARTASNTMSTLWEPMSKPAGRVPTPMLEIGTSVTDRAT